MSDFARSRECMINSQLKPSGIIDQSLLSAFAKVPREKYLPENRQSTAYVDEDILITPDSFLMEPVVLGRMLQVANLQPGDIALNIGDNTGYSTALLSDIVTTIVAVESDPGIFNHARVQWAESDFCNIAVLPGNPVEGCPKHAPYNLILINASITAVPEALKNQLTIGGRLVTVLRGSNEPMGRITLIRRDGPRVFSSFSYYDAATPFSAAFKPAEAFSF